MHYDEISWTESVAGPRWREVDAYAEQRGIPAQQAVAELINKGLSHLDDED